MKPTLQKLLSGTALLFALLVVPAKAQSTTNNYLLSTSDTWEDGTAWSTGLPPVSTDVTSIDTTGTYTVTTGTEAIMVYSLDEGNSNTSADVTLDVYSSQFNVGPVSVFNQGASSDSIGENSTLNVENGAVMDVGGAFNSRGTINVAAGGTLEFGQDAPNDTFQSTANITVNGTLKALETGAGYNANFNINGGGTMTVSGASALVSGDGFQVSSYNNPVTINITNGATFTMENIQAYSRSFSLDGLNTTVNFNLVNGTVNSSGTMDAGYTTDGRTDLTAGQDYVNISGGTFTQTGTLYVGGHNQYYDTSSGSPVLVPGAFTGSFGELNVSGGISNLNDLEMTGGANSSYIQSAGTVNVTTLNIGGTYGGGASATFSGGTLNTGGTSINAAGTGAGFAFLVGDGTHTAVLNLASGGTGTHTFTEGLELSSTGSLTGQGTITSDSAVTADTSTSVISPGSAAALGTLTLNGGLTAANGLTMDFKLDGATNDSLSVGTAFTLAGTIDVNFTSLGAGIQTGTVYTLAAGSGAWSDVGATFDYVAPAGYIVSSSDFDSVNDVYTVEFAAAPEPSTWAMLGLGLAFLVVHARSKQREI